MRVINIFFQKCKKLICQRKKKTIEDLNAVKLYLGCEKTRTRTFGKICLLKFYFFLNKNYLKQQQLVQYIGYNTNTTLLVYFNDLTKSLASSRCLMFSNTWEDLEPLVTLATDPAAVSQHLRIIWRPMKGSNSFHGFAMFDTTVPFETQTLSQIVPG